MIKHDVCVPRYILEHYNALPILIRLAVDLQNDPDVTYEVSRKVTLALNDWDDARSPRPDA